MAKEVFSDAGECLLGLRELTVNELSTPVQHPGYIVLFIKEGEGIYHADFGEFPFTAPVLLFATPMQAIHIQQQNTPSVSTLLQFHGDFYCIEYHRAEVSCNGLLFNNIYIQPSIKLTNPEALIFDQFMLQLKEEIEQESPAEAVLRAYLQLFLAKSSSIKMKSISTDQERPEKDELMERFRELLDEHYLTLHTPHDYAELLSMTSNNLTKRCTRYFKKSPSQLIQERLILEAKKLLHLTRQSIKEIAYALQFKDEFYFSRVFKKFTNVSPQAFRNATGISIMADLSK